MCLQCVIEPHLSPPSLAQFSYSDSDGNPVHVVQLTFLKLLSATAKQTFTYSCQNSAGWFDSAARSHKHALRFRGSNDEEMTQAKSPFVQALYDGCMVGARDGDWSGKELALLKLTCLLMLLSLSIDV